MVSGDLSTAEKLVSQNPAARREGQRELSTQTSTQQRRTVSKATSIASKGFVGTVTPQQVQEETADVQGKAKFLTGKITVQKRTLDGSVVETKSSPLFTTPFERVQQQSRARPTQAIQEEGFVEEEKPQGEFRAAPVPTGFLEGGLARIREERETVARQPQLTKQAKGFALGVGAVGVGTALFFKELSARPRETARRIKEVVVLKTKRVLAGETVFPGAKKVILEEPGFALGIGAGELGVAKGLGKVAKVGRRITTEVGTRLSPKFKPVITEPTGRKVIKVPSKVVGRKVVELEISRPVTQILEPLPKQAKRAGQVTDVVTAQRGLFGRVTKQKVTVDKPLPTPDSPQLERALFGSPEAQLRISRLGIVDQPEAKLRDFLSGDVTFRRERPQALLFEQERIAPFPKELKSVERKLKAGRTITPSEEARLLKFQLEPSGEFKTPGFLSKEPEVTLAPGEVIRKKRTAAVTVIEGRRVPIFSAEIEQPLLKGLSKPRRILKRKGRKVNLSRELETRPRISKSKVSGALLPSRRISRGKVSRGVSLPKFSPSVSGVSKGISRAISGKPSLPPSVPSYRPSVSSPIRSPLSRTLSRPSRRPPFRPPTYAPPIPRPPVIPFLQLPGLKKKKKGKQKLGREFRFTPSLVALEGNIKGRKPKVLTGIEIRKITA